MEHACTDRQRYPGKGTERARTACRGQAGAPRPAALSPARRFSPLLGDWDFHFLLHPVLSPPTPLALLTPSLGSYSESKRSLDGRSRVALGCPASNACHQTLLLFLSMSSETNCNSGGGDLGRLPGEGASKLRPRAQGSARSRNRGSPRARRDAEGLALWSAG